MPPRTSPPNEAARHRRTALKFQAPSQKRPEERRRDGDRDEKLRSIDAADDVSRRMSASQQGRCHDRTPTPAAAGVEKSTDQPQRNDVIEMGGLVLQPANARATS